MQRASRRRARTGSGLPAHTGAFVTLAALLVTTGVYYAAIRAHNVDLTFVEHSAFERQMHVIGNTTAYVVELDKESLLTTLPAEDWAALSGRIEAVVFTRGDMWGLLGSEVVEGVGRAVREVGKGIVMFGCGCALRNEVVKGVGTRFGGDWCVMVPGFVVGSANVTWVEGDGGCGKKRWVEGSGWYTRHAEKLETARGEWAALKM